MFLTTHRGLVYKDFLYFLGFFPDRSSSEFMAKLLYKSMATKYDGEKFYCCSKGDKRAVE
jgi:hypothetical protein